LCGFSSNSNSNFHQISNNCRHGNNKQDSIGPSVLSLDSSAAFQEFYSNSPASYLQHNQGHISFERFYYRQPMQPLQVRLMFFPRSRLGKVNHGQVSSIGRKTCDMMSEVQHKGLGACKVPMGTTAEFSLCFIGRILRVHEYRVLFHFRLCSRSITQCDLFSWLQLCCHHFLFGKDSEATRPFVAFKCKRTDNHTALFFSRCSSPAGFSNMVGQSQTTSNCFCPPQLVCFP